MCEHVWRGIETAPKDGTAILLFDDRWVFLGRWRSDDPRYPWEVVHADGPYAMDTNGLQDGKHGPTHWMPLPVAPREEP